MTGNRSRTYKLPLSLAGILALVLLGGPACVPAEFRAGAASRMAEFAQDLDAALVDAWRMAFPSRASDYPARASAGSNGAGLPNGAPQASTGVDARLLEAAGTGPLAINAFGTGAFNPASADGSASSSPEAFLRDILKDANSGGPEGFGGLGKGFAGTGNAAAGSGGAGVYSGGVGAPASGIPPTGFSRSSSQGGAPSQDRNVAGLAAVNPSAPNAHSDARQGRVAGLENGFGAVSTPAGGGNLTAWSGTLIDPMSAETGNSDWNRAPSDGWADNTLDATTGDPVRQLLSGVDHPFQSGTDHGPVSQNHVPGSQNHADNGGDVRGGDGSDLDFDDKPANGPHGEDHGSHDKTVPTIDPDPGLVAGVPEPGSLTLLSLGLGAVILWRTFRSAH